VQQFIRHVSSKPLRRILQLELHTRIHQNPRLPMALLQLRCHFARFRVKLAKIQRSGATLRATGGARGGTPWVRSASGHGAQAAPVVRLLTLAQADATQISPTTWVKMIDFTRCACKIDEHNNTLFFLHPLGTECHHFSSSSAMLNVVHSES